MCVCFAYVCTCVRTSGVNGKKVNSYTGSLYSAIYNPQDCLKRFALYSLTDLFNRTPPRRLLEASLSLPLMSAISIIINIS